MVVSFRYKAFLSIHVISEEEQKRLSLGIAILASDVASLPKIKS